MVTYFSSHSKSIDQLVNSPARLLIEDGKLVQKGLQREWLRQDTLQFELRLNGQEHPKEIRKATLEPEGQVSVITADSNQPVQKKDLRLLR